ncbi:MAG: DUF309 domain-containing protein [Nitriliruptoraceae bacterium]
MSEAAGASGPRRDRRDDGRPEQARPRDRTGRPLPHGTTGVVLAEEHAPGSVEEALELGVRLWGEHRYFEAHECLEEVWHAAPAEDADLWQGVIQIAVACVHVQRENPDGAVTLFRRAADRLGGYPQGHRGVDVARAIDDAQRAAAQVADGGVDEVALPGFPAMPGGPWYAASVEATAPPGSPTPLPDGPAWSTAARDRARDRRKGR